MHSTSFAIGILAVVAFMEIGINCSVVRFMNIGERYNDSSPAFNAQVDNGFLEWLFQILKPTSPTPISTPVPTAEPMEGCPPCKCGLANTQRRIVGGVETRKNQYPWMAQMIMNGKFYCGATVINSRYVVTAAHCVDRFDVSSIVVRVGDHDRSSVTETKTQDFQVERVIKHGGYTTANFNNDIAVVKLRGAIKFEGLMRPVCLAERGPTYAGKDGIVTGWGAIEESGPTSNTLLEVTVPIMTNAECKTTRYPARRITDNMMCAGYVDVGGKDSCQGDSGGPLHVVSGDDKIHRLVGVVSWGEGCALPRYPGVYTRVNRYLTWLERNTADACYCD